MKKKAIVILLMFVLIISASSLTSCGSDGSIISTMESSPSANCLTYTGYTDDLGTYGDILYFYDKDTNVMYAYSNTKAGMPLYNVDGTLVTYDEWLSNKTMESNNDEVNGIEHK